MQIWRVSVSSVVLSHANRFAHGMQPMREIDRASQFCIYLIQFQLQNYPATNSNSNAYSIHHFQKQMKRFLIIGLRNFIPMVLFTFYNVVVNAPIGLKERSKMSLNQSQATTTIHSIMSNY
jgi:hypothetical protein